MKNTTKTFLDLIMGAVIPIIILDRFSGPDALGAIPAYILAAMVPVAWVVIDLFFITKKFNFITSYVGFTSLVSGLLTFWFVDGVLYALKDSVGLLLRALIFWFSLLLGQPLVKFFLMQVLQAETPEQEQKLSNFFAIPSIQRSFKTGTWIIVIETFLATIANFFLNWWMVVAPFGGEEFNQQVAKVNAITRVALTVPSMIAFMIAIWIMYRAVYAELPSEDDKPQLESDFWDLMKLREARDTQ
jgi:hypothetical protein